MGMGTLEDIYHTLAYVLVQECYENFDSKESLINHIRNNYRISEEELKALEDIYEELYGE